MENNKKPKKELKIKDKELFEKILKKFRFQKISDKQSTKNKKL